MSRKLLVLILLAYLLPNIHMAFISPYNRDEAEYVYAGKLVHQGEKPYVDFFEHKTPGIMYGLGFLMGYTSDITVLRLLTTTLPMILIMLLLYRFAGRLQNQRTALYSVIAFLTFPIVSGNMGYDIFTDQLMTLFMFLGIILLYRGYTLNDNRYAAASAVSLAVAWLFKQMALFAVPGILLFLLFNNRRTLAVFLSAFAFAFLLLNLALYLEYGFDFLYSVYLFNMTYTPQNTLLARLAGIITGTSPKYLPGLYLPLVIVASARITGEKKYFLTLTLTYCLMLLFVRDFLNQYVMGILPLLSLVVAKGFELLYSSSRPIAFVLAAVVMASTLGNLYFDPIILPDAHRSDKSTQLDIATFISDNSNANGTILSATPVYSILSGMEPGGLGRRIFVTNHILSVFPITREDLENDKPGVVIDDPLVQEYPPPVYDYLGRYCDFKRSYPAAGKKTLDLRNLRVNVGEREIDVYLCENGGGGQ